MKEPILSCGRCGEPVTAHHGPSNLCPVLPLATGQPAPKPGKKDVTLGLGARVAARHDARRALGLASYGTPLQTHNGRDAFEDLADELTDAQAYAEQARMEREDMRAEFDRLNVDVADLTRRLVKANDRITYLQSEAAAWVEKAPFAATPHDRVADALQITAGELIDARRRIAELEAANTMLNKTWGDSLHTVLDERNRFRDENKRLYEENRKLMGADH